MPYYVKGTNRQIRGTIETCEVTYPIQPDPDGIGWDYSGGESKVFDEGATVKMDENGEPLFLTFDGEEVPWPEIEWRDE